MYKTILINLNKDTDRLDFMVKQLEDLNMPFERLEAVYGKEYMEKDGSEYSEELAIKRWGRKMTLGEIGCTLSHKRCYQKFLNDPIYKDTKYLLILEDDVELDKNFKNILENEIKKNEENYKWDYLQFNYPGYGNFKDLLFTNFKKYSWQLNIIRSSKNFKYKIKRIPFLLFGPIGSFFLDLREYFILNNNKSYKQIRNKALAGAYLLNKKTTKSLLTNLEYITIIIDVFIIEFSQKSFIKSYFYKPIIARQKVEKFESSIDKIEKRF